MSKLAYLKATRGAAGGLPIIAGIASLASKVLPKVVKAGGKLLGIGKKAIASPVGQGVAGAAAYGAASRLMTKGSSGVSGSFGIGGYRRKGRGITATELRGFNKVAGLLHRVGMVPRKTRGYKKCK